MSYETVIGLEVHVQLSTNTKLFCGCSTKFGAEPNTQVCPVCLGMPGVLPVLNKKAVEFALRTATALDCTINKRSVFSRKNYFYPDLPKGYQISQFTEPIAEHGHLDIETSEGTKRIGITRIHMEEDAGKLLHGEGAEDESYSFADLNRACVPLIEIVSEPDIRSAEEAVAYMKAMRDIVVYTEVCDGNLEQGSFRCDANISIRPVGREQFGTRAELKNINSFKFVKDAIEYEEQRQADLLDEGGTVVQETRLFDSAKGITVSMRSKEEAHDYRYFDEPDLLPLVVPDAMIEEVQSNMVELPRAKRDRFVSEYSIPAYDAGVLTATRALADYYEAVVKETKEPKASSNWVMGELLRVLKDGNLNITDCPLEPARLADLVTMVKAGKINSNMGKEVFEEIYKTNKTAAEVVEAKGMTQISDEGELVGQIDKIIAAHPDEAERFKGGEAKLQGFFVGQIMKATRGQANPQIVNKLLKERLKG
jgi:aspartyl-tRNA(Asn)/glutamyl-tRNA(Gln) amidotransferase subunit B